ncbi:DUF1983 domain-containing protein [Vibrio fluvialis]|nr:DUF1983 domain-containing protein [Vibrio fluvialis]
MAYPAVAGYLAAISAVVSAVTLAYTLSMKKPGQDLNDSGTQIDRRGRDEPKVIPFGRCLVPAIRVYNNVNNQHTRNLAQVYSLGHGPIKGFEQVYIDSVPYFKGNTAPNVWHSQSQTGEFSNVAMGLRLGRITEQAYPDIINNSDGEWNSEFRGDSTASIHLLAHREIGKGDQEHRFMTDRVKVEALVQGVAVIDPRLGLENRVWGNSYRNPACVVLTYLIDSEYGMGLPADAINIESFIELANWCDREKLYFDGFVDQSSDFGSILLDMVTSFDGMVYFENGQMVVRADRATPVTEHIGMGDIIGDFSLSNGGDSEYYNVVKAEFVNSDSQYSKDQFVLPKNVATDPIIKSDGFQKSIDLKFMFTTDTKDAATIRKFVNKKLKQSRFLKTVEFTYNNVGKNIRIYDVITVTNTDYGIENKKFRVTSLQTTLDEKTTETKLTASEYDDSVYDESGYSDGVTSDPLKPSTNIIPAPAGLVFEQTGFTTTGSGVLSWVTEYGREHRTIIEYKLSSSSDWVRLPEVLGEQYRLNNLAPDNYDFRVQTMSFIGSTSKWTTITNQQVKGGVTLPAPTGLQVTFDSADCLVSWDDMKAASLNVLEGVHYDGVTNVGGVFSHYSVAVFKGDSQVYSDTISVSDNSLNYNFALNQVGGQNRDLRFDIKIVALDGSESETTSITAHNNQCIQPSGLKVNGKLTELTINWDTPAESDYLASDIHISDVADFTPSVQTLVQTVFSPSAVLTVQLDGVHYLRVANYDVFGKDGIAYSPALAFTMETIDDLLENSNTWGGAIGDIDAMKEDIRQNATDIDSVSKTVGTQGAAITQNAEAIQSTQGNLATLEESVTAELEGVKGSVKTNTDAIATTNQAMGQLKTEVTAEIDGVKASVEETSSAVADIDGKVNSLYTLKLTSGDKVSGLIMGNNGETSTFDVIADRFRISDAAGSQAVFQVNTESGQTVIRNALIQDLTATNIKAGSITGNNISSNTKIVAGAGNASVVMDGQDTNWRLYAGNAVGADAPFRVDASGKLFAENAEIKGHIVAESGSFKGHVEAESGSFTGHVVAESGSFKGHVEAESGSFTGEMYATKGTMDNVVINENCTVKGIIAADQIQGDVATAALVNLTTSPMIPPLGDAGGTWLTMGQVSCTNRTNKAAIFHIPVTPTIHKVDYMGTSADYGYNIATRVVRSGSGVVAEYNYRIEKGDPDGIVSHSTPSASVVLQPGQSATLVIQAHAVKSASISVVPRSAVSTVMASFFRVGAAFS